MLEFNPQPKVTKKKQISELKKWKAKCWKLISELTRRQGASFSGMALCYTCGSPHHWKELHCGHYIHGKLDFDSRNLKPQCVKCNMFLSGALDVYTLKLIDQNGLEWVKQLRNDAAKHPGYSTEELKTIEADLKARLILLPKV